MDKFAVRLLAYEAFKEHCLWCGVNDKISFAYYTLFTRYTDLYLSL